MLSNNSNGDLVVTFPDGPETINYLYTTLNSGSVLPAGGLLTIQGQTVCEPPTVVFHWDDTQPPPEQLPSGTLPNLRPFFWANNNGQGEFDRWWSTGMRFVKLEPGLFEIQVSLNPSEWSSVLGKVGSDSPTTIAAFNNALAHPSRVGMTFGGGSFYGHGVYATGGVAQTDITRYMII
jgi:hypothetical protein